jgi:CRISPR-associated protein Cmr1
MRRLPDEIRDLAEEVGVIQRQDADTVTQTRSYRLITPLFGGGVESKESDPIKCVTEKGIRGQLRFWWRACKGASALTGQQNILRDMKKREDEIWGNASSPDNPLPSKVSLVVAITNEDKVTRDQPYMLNDQNRPRANRESIVPPYAAFPLQPTDDEVRDNPYLPMREVLLGVTFDLRLTFPTDKRDDVEAALWCWETFGGVGGRTRRGFGALELIRVAEGPDAPDAIAPLKWTANDAEQKIKEKIAAVCGQGNWAPGVPHLSPGSDNLKVTSKKDTSIHADESIRSWRHLVDCLQKFRQSRNPGRQANRPGRSHWPEPDELRRKYTAKTGRTTPHEPTHPVRKFPRAAFGLPIIFHFQGNEIPDATLKGADHDRLASPLILRPLSCANGEAVGLALIIDGTSEPPGGVMLKNDGAVATDLDLDPQAEAAKIVPLSRINPIQTNVLKAFLKTV